MQQYNVGAPFERIAMDVAGPFPTSDSGNKYVLVVMDYFSKWPEVYPIPNQETTTIADAVVHNWISCLEYQWRFIQTKDGISNQLCSRKCVECWA
jgi:hypothetical protein